MAGDLRWDRMQHVFCCQIHPILPSSCPLFLPLPTQLHPSPSIPSSPPIACSHRWITRFSSQGGLHQQSYSWEDNMWACCVAIPETLHWCVLLLIKVMSLKWNNVYLPLCNHIPMVFPHYCIIEKSTEKPAKRMTFWINAKYNWSKPGSLTVWQKLLACLSTPN